MKALVNRLTLIPAVLLTAVSMTLAVPAFAASKPFPGVSIVIKGNPGNRVVGNPSTTNADGSFEVKGLPMGVYEVVIGSCAPVPFAVGTDGNVMGGVVTGDGSNTMIRQDRGGDPKSNGFKQAHPSAPEAGRVVSCAMDAKAKEAWRRGDSKNAAK